MGIRELTIALVLPITIALNANPQEPAPSADLLVRFDNEHDLAKKERLLQEITANHVGVGPALLRVAEFTKNSDTRWMAMRGMSTVHCIDCAPFLESSLKSPNALVRANAARSLGDLRLTASGPKILAMFVAEKDPGTIEQASLALRVLDIREAVPFIRTKIPQYTWQTRGWLLQALGTLGGPTDVPLIGGYLNSSDKASAMSATSALQELTGVSFGPRPNGPSGYPPPDMLAARAWWSSHEQFWPRCDDCHYRR